MKGICKGDNAFKDIQYIRAEKAVDHILEKLADWTNGYKTACIVHPSDLDQIILRLNWYKLKVEVGREVQGRITLLVEMVPTESINSEVEQTNEGK